MKKLTRILAVILTLAVLCGALATVSFARENEGAHLKLTDVNKDIATWAYMQEYTGALVNSEYKATDASTMKFIAAKGAESTFWRDYSNNAGVKTEANGNTYMFMDNVGITNLGSSQKYWDIFGVWKETSGDGAKAPAHNLAETNYFVFEFTMACHYYIDEEGKLSEEPLNADGTQRRLAYPETGTIGNAANTTWTWTWVIYLGNKKATVTIGIVTEYVEGDGWYAVVKQSATAGATTGANATSNKEIARGKLSDVAGVWNHVALVLDMASEVSYGDIEGVPAHEGVFDKEKFELYTTEDTSTGDKVYNYNFNYSKTDAYVYVNGEYAGGAIDTVIGSEADDPAWIAEKGCDLQGSNLYNARLTVRKKFNETDMGHQCSISLDNIAQHFYGNNYESVDRDPDTNEITKDYIGLDDVIANVENAWPLYAADDVSIKSSYNVNEGKVVKATLYSEKPTVTTEGTKYEVSSGAFKNLMNNYYIETSDSAEWFAPEGGISFYVKYTGKGEFKLSDAVVNTYKVLPPDADGWSYVTLKTDADFFHTMWFKDAAGTDMGLATEGNDNRSTYGQKLEIPESLVEFYPPYVNKGANKYSYLKGFAALDLTTGAADLSTLIAVGEEFTTKHNEIAQASGFLQLVPVYEDIELAYMVYNADGLVIPNDDVTYFKDATNFFDIISATVASGYCKVVIYKDMVLEDTASSIVMVADAELHIDLNGCKVTRPDAATSIAFVTAADNNKVNIYSSAQNGEIDIIGRLVSVGAKKGVEITLGKNGEISGENLTVKATQFVYIASTKNASLTTDNYAGIVTGAASLSINGGKYYAYDRIANAAGPFDLAVENAYVNAAARVIYADLGYASVTHVTIKNSTIVSYSVDEETGDLTYGYLLQGYNGVMFTAEELGMTETPDAYAALLPTCEIDNSNIYANVLGGDVATQVVGEGDDAQTVIHSTIANAVKIGAGTTLANSAYLPTEVNGIVVAKEDAVAVNAMFNETVDGVALPIVAKVVAADDANIATVTFKMYEGNVEMKWYKGSAIPAAPDTENIAGLYFLEFVKWTKAGADATVIDGDAELVAVYTPVADVQGILVKADESGNVFSLEIYVPVNAALAVKNAQAVRTVTIGEGDDAVEYAVYTKVIDLADISAVALELEVTVENAPYVQTVEVAFIDYVKEVLNGEYAESEKKLVANALNYFAAVYKYVNDGRVAEEYEAVLATVANLIEAAPAAPAENVLAANDVIGSVTYYISEEYMPVLLFTLKVEALPQDFAITCEGEAVQTAEVTLNGTKYLAVNADHTATIAITIGGTTYNYNVAVYAAAGVDTCGVAAAFYGYIAAAKAHFAPPAAPEEVPAQ